MKPKAYDLFTYALLISAIALSIFGFFCWFHTGTPNILTAIKVSDVRRSVQRDEPLYAHLSRGKLLSKKFGDYRFEQNKFQTLMEGAPSNPLERLEPEAIATDTTIVIVTNKGETLGYVSAKHVNFEGKLLKARVISDKPNRRPFVFHSHNLLEIDVQGENLDRWKQVVSKYGATVEDLGRDLLMVKGLNADELKLLIGALTE